MTKLINAQPDFWLQKLQPVLENQRMLPAESYTDESCANLERQSIFESGWTGIAFASSISEKGVACPLEVFGIPLLVTRDHQDQLHVFANVCRHRGHVLVPENCADKNLLVCPYHAWSYTLDGQFKHAPFWDGSKNSAPDEDQKKQLGLVPIRFAVWYDIILVNLNGNAPPFTEFIEPLQSRWQEDCPASMLRKFSEKTDIIAGNWKLAAENFLDNYHLPWVHPEVGSSIESSLGLEVTNLQLSPDIIGFTHPTSGKDKVKTSSPLPGWPAMSAELLQRQDLFFIFPNICMVMEGNYLWSMLLLPETAASLNEKIALYVVGEDALDATRNESRRQLENVIYKINDQDAAVINQLQKGRRSTVASDGVFNQRHDQLGIWFQQQIAARINNFCGNGRTLK